MKRFVPNSNLYPVQHSPPVFFLDRNLGGKKVPAALIARSWKVELHDSHFAHNTEDYHWIREVGKRGWIILTADRRIQYNPLERDALMQSGTLAFVLASRKNLTGEEIAKVFIDAEKVIFSAIEREKPNSVFRVYREGAIKRWDLER